MAVRVNLKGNAELGGVHIPASWIGQSGITHSSDYNISVKSLEDIGTRLKQQKYWLKNQERTTLLEFTFDDRFVENEWHRTGTKQGQYGKYWNPAKLDKLQDHLDQTLYVPDDFFSMKEVKKRFGDWATKEKVEEAGFEVRRGRKRGHGGSMGNFVTPRIMDCTLTISPADGMIPVRNVFSEFPNLSAADIHQIADQNIVEPAKKKYRYDGHVSRLDLMVSVDSLMKIEPQKEALTRNLRSREVTKADVQGGSKSLRKLLKKK